ncbi:MAG TPA: discoidin domain-containing protein [Frankiaceae bacterium]|nr:discoidin domain-containing protein [Frankiaceae bacterium]
MPRVRLRFPHVFVTLALVVGLAPPPATAAAPAPLIGAIRWDAWAPQYSYSAASTYTDYSYRQPSLGWHNSGVPNHAAIVDQEIEWAAAAGIDYWSFVWYPETTGNQQGAIMSAFNDYMASPKHDRLKFTFMLQTPWVAHGKATDPHSHEARWRTEFVPYFVEKFRDPQYVKVNGNRPLLYWFETAKLAHCDDGFCTQWREQLQYLTDRTVAAGLGAPFIVDNTYDVAAARTFGLQGVTSYGPAGARPWGSDGQTCWDAQAERDRTNLVAHPGLVTVPALTPVNDGRPRGHDWWVDQPTYGQWERHARQVRDWARNNPSRTTSPPTILTYAWNELDEGGPGIVPTKQNGSMYLDALRAVTTGEYPAQYDDVLNADNCRIGFTGGWSRAFPVQGLFNNDEQVTTQPGATAELTWPNVTGFRVKVRRGPDRGQLQILLDGVPRAMVDLYAPSAEVTEVSVDAPPGTHTLTLVATGVRSALSSGSAVGLDSITAKVVRDAAAAPPVTMARPDNLAKNGTYRASSTWDANQAPARAFDGWYDTNWQAASGSRMAGSWLEVDFGAETAFDQVMLTEYGNRTTGFQIQYWNGVSWLTAYTGTTIGDGVPRTFSFPRVRGSRARVLFTSGYDTPILYEFEVYATPGP